MLRLSAVQLDKSKTKLVHPFGFFLTVGILHSAISCVAYLLCQLQLPYPSSSLPTITTSFLPHWNSAWHTDTSWHKAQRESSERERERGRNTQEPLPIVWCPLGCVCAKHSSRLADQGTRQSNRYFPLRKSAPIPRSFVGNWVCCVCLGLC